MPISQSEGAFEVSQNERIDVNSTSSERKGLAGLAETVLRRFNDLGHFVLLTPLYLIGCAMVGLAVWPGLLIFQFASDFSVQHNLSNGTSLWLKGAAGAAAYLSYGFSLLILAPLVNKILVGRLPKWRGAYYSLPAIRWYIHNGLTYLVRYTFLEFVTPSPMNIFFYRMMGMRIGRGTIINSTHLSDPSLIEMGKKVTVGGSVAIVGHYGQGGYLVLAPVKIESGVTLGLRCVVLGGAHIGEGAKILPNSAVLPKTIVPAGETWGGVPAKKIEIETLTLKKVA